MSTTKSIELPQAACVVLARTLGAESGAWLPVRGDGVNFEEHAVAWYARQRDRSVRLSISRGGSYEGISYWRSELSRLGLMLGHRLTPRGKQIARAFTWPYEKSDLKRAARRLVAAIAKGHVHPDEHDRSYVPECYISGEFWGSENARLQRLFLPWTADGVIEARVDFNGTAFYSPADSKIDLVRLADNVIDGRFEFDDGLSDVFDTEIRRVRAEILADRRHYNEIGEPPLRLAKLKSGCSAWEPPKLRPLFDDGGADSH
jgi:hypothetical protein